jgi:hypothetical protein
MKKQKTIYMTTNEKIGDCAARLAVDSPGYFFVQALRKMHEEQKKYDFVPFEEICKRLTFEVSCSIKDFENGIIDGLMKMDIVEQDEKHFQFRIHPEHWIPLESNKAPG